MLELEINQILKINHLIWDEKVFSAIICFILIFWILLLWTIKKSKYRKIQLTAMLLQFFVLIGVFTITVLGRTPAESRSFQFVPFWSYAYVLEGNWYILKQMLLNVVLLFPTGFFLPLVAYKRLKWHTGFLYGISISTVIELLQFLTYRGMFEFDDIWHNGIGCMLGCILSVEMIKKNLD